MPSRRRTAAARRVPSELKLSRKNIKKSVIGGPIFERSSPASGGGGSQIFEQPRGYLTLAQRGRGIHRHTHTNTQTNTHITHKHTHKHAHKHLHTHIYAFVCSTAVSPPSLALAHVRRDALATQSYCFSIILMVLYTSQPTCVCFLCDTAL